MPGLLLIFIFVYALNRLLTKVCSEPVADQNIQNPLLSNKLET